MCGAFIIVIISSITDKYSHKRNVMMWGTKEVMMPKKRQDSRTSASFGPKVSILSFACLFCFMFLLLDRVFLFQFWLAWYVAQAGPELSAILMSQSPECCDFRHVPSCPAYFYFEMGSHANSVPLTFEECLWKPFVWMSTSIFESLH